MNEQQLKQAIDKLRQQNYSPGDLVKFSEADLQASSLVKFINTIHNFDSEVLCRLTLIVARFAISPGDYLLRSRFGLASRYLKDSTKEKNKSLVRQTQLIQNLELINQYLTTGSDINWTQVRKFVFSSTSDCRSEWQEAEASAVSNCAQYVYLKQVKFAIACIIDADHALEIHRHDFWNWFVEKAILLAWSKKAKINIMDISAEQN